MSESSSKALLIKKLAPIHAVAIESPRTGSGIPDVNHRYGWIECKWMKAWPRRAETHPVKFPHELTKAQQLWGWQRTRAGGQSLVCAKVSDEWFFFDCWQIKENDLWDNMTRPDMLFWAQIYFKKTLDAEELIGFLRGYRQ